MLSFCVLCVSVVPATAVAFCVANGTPKTTHRLSASVRGGQSTEMNRLLSVEALLANGVPDKELLEMLVHVLRVCWWKLLSECPCVAVRRGLRSLLVFWLVVRIWGGVCSVGFGQLGPRWMRLSV